MDSSSRLLTYELLHRGLIARETLVDGDWVVVTRPSRHQAFLLRSQRGPSYFAKQARADQVASAQTLWREAACYQLIASDPALKPLADLTPRYFFYDPQKHFLVLELLPDAENLGLYHRRVGGFPIEIATKIGRSLGAYHKVMKTPAGPSGFDGVFPKQPPSVLSFHKSGSGFFANNGATAQLHQIIAGFPQFAAGFEGLAAQWQPTALIHGDMKWENCVLTPRDAAIDDVELKVIDWELADIGDPAWDVGSIFQSYIAFWVFNLPPDGTALHPDAAAKVQDPVTRMRPALRAFWDSYADSRGLSEVARPAVLERCMKFAAARMVQTAYEASVHAQTLHPNTVYLLQVSANIFDRYQNAIRSFLGD